MPVIKEYAETREAAEALAARIKAEYPPAGYDTILRVIELNTPLSRHVDRDGEERTMRYLVIGSRLSSCD